MNIDVILILIVLTNLRLLGSSRLGASIRTVAVQGFLIGLLPLLAHDRGALWQVLILAIGSMALKGVVFPRLLLRALREADVRREVEPFVGNIMSLLVELGVLLDVFVAVFVMGIMIFHISREFDHLDTDRLSTHRD